MRLLSLFVFLVALPAWAGPNPYVNEQYELTKVADGVYSLIAPDSDSGVVQSNCTVIIGDESVLIVDSGSSPPLRVAWFRTSRD